MAKKPKTNVNTALLAAIVEATKAGGHYFVTKDEGFSLFEQKLIIVNTEVTEGDKAAAKATAAGIAMIDAPAAAPASNPAPSGFVIITDAVPPKSKRGGGRGGAPSKYPFEALEVGQSFLVGNHEVTSGDAVKSMQSSVASANNRFAQETGETKSVMRTKRGEGNKAVKNTDGTNVKEAATVAIKKQLRKFTVRPVEAGKVYGGWTAPASGALITRVAVTD